MKKSLVLLACSLLRVSSYLFSAQAATPVPPIVVVRPSMFSTSTDWEAVTGLRLNEYQLVFGRDRTVSNVGVELYFLDGFPCYGQAETARVWVSPSNVFAWDENRDAQMRITCLSAPEKIYFAYREAKVEATQAKTKGILSCDTEKADGRNIKIRLEDCIEGDDWQDYGKR